MTDFTEFIYKKLSMYRESRGPGPTSQAKLAGLLGVTDSYVNQILRRTCPPLPLESVDAWATALQLNADETALLHQLAGLEHAPELVKTLVKSQQLELARLRQEVTDLRAEVADLGAELARLRSKKPKVRGDA